MPVYAIGDSHIRIFKHFKYRGDKINLLVRSATTLFSVARDGLEAVLSPAHKSACRPLDAKRSPGKGDVVFISFGYVDILNNIHRRENTEEEVKSFVKTYCDKLSSYKRSREISKVYVDTELVPQTAKNKLKYSGDLASRRETHKWVQKALEDECNKRADLIAWGYGNQFMAEDGSLDHTVVSTEDLAHIGHSWRTALVCKGCDKCTGEAAQRCWREMERVLDE